MSNAFISTSIRAAMGWAQAQALKYLSVNTGCCADELLQALGCRYDLERFGVLPEQDPVSADLLIVAGAFNPKATEALLAAYAAMPAPKYVMALGTCASSGGLFGAASEAGGVLPGIAGRLPVDVFVPGCPPRPEAIIDGLIFLQYKIQGRKAPAKRQARRPERMDSPPLEEWGRG